MDPARTAPLPPLVHALPARVPVCGVRQRGGNLSGHLHLLLPGRVVVDGEEGRVDEQCFCGRSTKEVEINTMQEKLVEILSGGVTKMNYTVSFHGAV